MTSPAKIFLPTHLAVASAALETPVAPPLKSPVQLLQERIHSWQERTFPNQPLNGKLAHLCREAAELRDKPDDASEWADVFILLLGAAAKAGIDTNELISLSAIKMLINENRQWGPADSEGVHHHIG